MSRCFPYPPPGYTLSRAGKEALIESIKLQKEREKAKEQRKKEKRREKKDKRKEKKEKNVETNQKSEYYETLKGSTGKSILAKSEQLVEKSSITEEYEQPICLPLPSSSSESTENSNKRKRQSSPTDGNQGYCNIIRLRMPSKIQNASDTSIDEHQLFSTYERSPPSKILKDSDVSINERQLCSTSGRMPPSKIQNDSDASINEQQPCSTSGRTDIPAHSKDDCLGNKQEKFCCLFKEINNFGQGFTPKTDKKSICSTSVKIDSISPGKTESPSEPGAVATSIKRQEFQRQGLLYKNLVENCLPPLQQDTLFDSDDLSWLFPGKNKGSPTMKKQKSDGMPCSIPSSLWQPRAQYLPQVDQYALPYTVPF